MSVNDPISNMLNLIRNGIMARKETVDIPASKLNEQILNIFKNDGYIQDLKLMKTNTQGAFKVYLKYDGKKSAIMGLRRVSRPGLRVYKDREDLPKVLNGLGTAVISTSKGVLPDREARKQNVGGEVLCHIW